MADKKNMAICAVAAEAGISKDEMRDILIKAEDKLIEVSFRTDWLLYDCYVDEETLDVLGFDSRPAPLNMLLEDLPESGQSAS